MHTKFLIFFFALLIFSSCNESESIIPTDPHSPLLELQFSNPPINLQGVAAQFAADIPYDGYDKTKFDIFLPTSSSPTGLVIFIHGGGFTGGDKAFIYTGNFEAEIVELLSKGIAVATINYRLIVPNDEEGVIKSLNDAKRAIQYIRYVHQALNLDKENIVLFGSSAGASAALWLATKDDLKEENSSDVVLHESSRVKGIALNATQSSLDIEKRWLGDVFVEFGVSLADITNEFGAENLYNFYGVSTKEAYESSEIEAYRKRVDMLAELSSDDPEIWVTNTGGHNDEPLTSSSFNHHPFHAREIKEFADAAGVANVTTYGNPIIFSDANPETFVDFLVRKIKE
ncbi:MAG: alpha/beta hydrolase [Bacteroidota bacterium]